MCWRHPDKGELMANVPQREIVSCGYILWALGALNAVRWVCWRQGPNALNGSQGHSLCSVPCRLKDLPSCSLSLYSSHVQFVRESGTLMKPIDLTETLGMCPCVWNRQVGKQSAWCLSSDLKHWPWYPELHSLTRGFIRHVI